MACSACFLTRTQDHQPRDSTHHGLGPPSLTTNWENALQLAFHHLRLLLMALKTLASVRLAHKTSQCGVNYSPKPRLLSGSLVSPRLSSCTDHLSPSYDGPICFIWTVFLPSCLLLLLLLVPESSLRTVVSLLEQTHCSTSPFHGTCGGGDTSENPI